MSNLKVDYPGARSDSRDASSAKGSAGRPLRFPFRLLRWGALAVILAVVPFFLLIRGGVFAYHQWGLGAWPSLAVSAAATALLLVLYAWAMGRRLRAGRGLKWLLTRGAAAIGIAYVAYSLLYVGGANVKSEEVRAEYAALHPLLRVAASTLILADPGAVITDAGRTPDFYRRMGLSPNESSLHFDRTTASCTPWTSAPSVAPSGGTAPSSWRSGRWGSTRSGTRERRTTCTCR